MLAPMPHKAVVTLGQWGTKHAIDQSEGCADRIPIPVATIVHQFADLLLKIQLPWHCLGPALRPSLPDVPRGAAAGSFYGQPDGFRDALLIGGEDGRDDD